MTIVISSLLTVEVIKSSKKVKHKKMAKFVTILLALVSIFLGLTAALPTPDEERYLDKEYARELLNWLSALQAPVSNNPCKYYGNGLSGPMPKRNSELINSLLSLPKNMNDAGK